MAEPVIIVNEKYLLQITKCKQLSQIENLDLSSMNLNEASFDVGACNKLISLTDLDLSQNEIEDLPHDFILPQLKFLNISNNRFRSLNWICNFPNIQELDIYDNISLSVDERYKAIYLLKNIELIDGKGVTMKGNFREQFGEELQDKVYKLWKEDFYLKRYIDSKTENEKFSVKEEFLEKAKHKIRCGPNSLKAFRYWRICQVVEDMISNNNNKMHPDNTGVKKASKKRKAEDPSPQISAKSLNVSTKVISPLGKSGMYPESWLTAAVERVENGSMGMAQASKYYGIPRGTIRSRIIRGKRLTMTSPQSNKSSPKNQSEITKDFDCEDEENDEFAYKPLVFLQCHGMDDSADDLQQQVWCCQFEPNPDNACQSTNCVATCGGDSVCIIDCTTMKVKMKFQQANEEFYTLAWTSLGLVNSVQDNILACAGCLGYVHLIHTKQVVMYGRFLAHKKPVQTISFVPNHPSYLLTAGTDKRIVLWDIGIPSIPDYNFAHKKLAVFAVMDNPLRLLVPSNGYLLCGTERGLFCWNLHAKFPLAESVQKVKVYNTSIRFDFPHTDGNSLVDGLVAIDDEYIATKLAQTGVIFVWKWSSAVKMVKVCSADSIHVPTIAELNWSNSKQFYININSCRGRGTLFSGDEDGHLWIYKARSMIDELERKERLDEHKVHQATAIVPWPKCFKGEEHCATLDDGTMCNDICSNWDMSYLVVASDNNMVLVYKHEKPKKVV